MRHRRAREQLERVALGARAGDEEAWREFHALLRPYMATLVRRRFPPRLRARMDVEDVVQDAFVCILASLTGVESRGREGLRGWIRRLTLRTLYNRIEHHERLRRSVRREDTRQRADPLLDPRAERERTRVEDRIDVRVALAFLTDEERRVLRLRHVEGRAWKAVAQELERSVAACRSLEGKASMHLVCALGLSSRREREREREH